MCGIAGVWNRDGKPVDREVLYAMTCTLKHRGPDDEGFFMDGALGLGHTRLSIIDLSPAGRQPMSSADGRFTIVYNGEIYNYQELAGRYLKGVSLRSTSDTEVLLYLLAYRGRDVLRELRGMFALAMWDREKKELLLVRDPFGKKPLYYVERNGLFLFASEIKALLQHPAVGREADPVAVTKYFLYECVPSPATGYRDIRQVPMGCYAAVAHASCAIQTWWQPGYVPKYRVDEHTALQQLDELLSTAVRRRMIADVPVGVFLSGGIDSTSVAWYMRQATDAPLHSFSVSFRERSFDESHYARQAAQALGLVHHEAYFGLQDFHRVLDRVLPMLDVPFADASLLPTYAVSEMARSKITVALDGDGSDELFSGYGTFSAADIANYFSFVPPSVWRWLSEAASRIPTRYTYFSFDFKLKSFLRGMPYGLPRRNQIWLGSFSDRDLDGLLASAWRKHISSIFSDIDDLVPALRGLEATDQVSYLTLSHYLHNAILVKLDRATMFSSLEARTPFLDVDLAEFAMRLPVRLKRDKALLRRLMRGRIPDVIIDRSKQGFAMPLGQWLKGPLHAWARDVLDASKIAHDGILQPAYVRRLLEEHRAGAADHRKKLWTLLMYQLWYDRWIKRSV